MAMQMTVGRKLGFGFGALVALLVIFAAYSLWAIARMNDIQNELADRQLKKIHLAGMLNNLASQLGSSQRDFMIAVLTNNPDESGKSTADVQTAQAAFQKTLADLRPMLETERGRTVAAALDDDLRQFLNVDQELVRLCRSGKTQDAGMIRIQRSEPVLDRLDKETDELDALIEGVAAAAAKRGDDTAARNRTLALIIIAVSLGVGVLLLLLLRRINLALRQMAKELAQGAGEVANAASQVAGASQALARGASEQAASLQETSASSSQISSMAQKNSENSRSAAHLVTSSQQKFVETNEALEQTVRAMSEISAQSGKISRIIRAIDEIAFQTNILALNAAVEAARAGEAGMGFAVVADEVRNLAQRCAQAAQDTTALIEESVVKSSDGKTRVDQVAVAIRVVTEEAGKVKTLVDEVHMGSQEQARGIEQIARAITQMEQVTQNSAASAEESAAASEELTAQSEALKEIVSRLTAMVGGSDPASGGFDHPVSHPASLARGARLPASRLPALPVAQPDNSGRSDHDPWHDEEFQHS